MPRQRRWSCVTVIIAITRPSSGTFLPRRPPSSYPFLVAPTRRCGLLAASGAHPPPRRDPYSALLGWLSHTRCPPSWPFSPGPGGHLPTRGASLLAPTRPRPGGRPPREVPAFSALLARPRRASYSPTRPFFLPPVAVLGPHLAHLLAPSPPAPAGVSPPRPGKAPPFLALHDPLEGRGKKGRVGFCWYPPFFSTPPDAPPGRPPLTYSTSRRSPISVR